jgi:hypothetical protein
MLTKQACNNYKKKIFIKFCKKKVSIEYLLLNNVFYKHKIKLVPVRPGLKFKQLIKIK